MKIVHLHYHKKLYYQDQLHLELNHLNLFQVSQHLHHHFQPEFAQPQHYLLLQLSIHYKTQYHQMEEQQFF